MGSRCFLPPPQLAVCPCTALPWAVILSLHMSVYRVFLLNAHVKTCPSLEEATVPDPPHRFCCGYRRKRPTPCCARNAAIS